MFKPDYSSTHLNKAIELNDRDRELLLAEYEPLRNEVNHTIDRISSNEAACAAYVFALIAVSHLSYDFDHYPEPIVEVSSGILAVFAAFYGRQRSETYRRHMEMVDLYLRDLERRFSSHFGWTNFYNTAISTTDVPRQMGTRNIFWHILKFVAAGHLLLLFGGYALFAQ